MEKILCAAILTVKRHPEAQGFLTSYGRFVNRKETKQIAEQAGQLPNGTISNVLTSEDLYWDERRMEPTKRGGMIYEGETNYPLY